MSSKLTSTGTKKSKLLTSTASVSEKPSRIPQGRVYSINNFKNSTHTCPEKPTFRRPSLSSWRPEAKAELLSSNSTSDLSDQASGTSSHESSSLEQMLELCNNTSSSSKNEILTRASTSDSSVELQAHLVSKKTPEYTAKKQSLRSGRNQLKRLCSGSKEFVRKSVKGSSSRPSTTISGSLFDSSLNAHDKTRADKKLTGTKRVFVSRKTLAKQKKKKVNSRQHKNLICLQMFTRAHRISHTHSVHTLKSTVVDTCITSGLHRERSNEYFNPIPPGEGGGGRKVPAPISTFENFLDI